MALLVAPLLLLFIAGIHYLTLRPAAKPHPGQVWRYPMPAEEKKTAVSNALQQGRLALILDDSGYSLENFKKAMDLGKPLTFAILPHATHARETALLAHQQGSEVMLHLPMEPKNGGDYSLEKNTVMVGMDRERVRQIVRDGLVRVPRARGVNNHMGSRATEDPPLMKALMDTLQEEGLYFIDSRTSPRSLGVEIARRAGIPARSSDLFLDGKEDVAAIREAFSRAVTKARREGSAVAIGHLHPMTLQVLAEMLPQADAQGVKLVFASEVVQ